MNSIIERLFNVHVEEPDTTENPPINEFYDAEPLPIVEQTYLEKVPAPVLHQEPGGYEIVQRSRLVETGVADATGRCSIIIPSPGTGVAWMIERIGTICNSGSYASLVVYAGRAEQFEVLDVSSMCPDISDEVQPIWIENRPIEVVATGMSIGATLVVNFQYRHLRRILETEGM
jgi:hypothetical protein